MFTFLVIFVIVVLVVTRANQARAAGRGGGGRHVGGHQACPACGEAHPPFAQFCRRCGRRLP